MLQLITLNRLNEIAAEIVSASFPYFEELREMYRLLYLCGCRSMECFEINRWHLVSGDIYSLQPQKGNNLRMITLDSTFTTFKAAISGQYSPFLGRTISQALNLFDRIREFNKVYCNAKEITFYLFRYRYVRRLTQEGKTLAEIAYLMGYTTTANIYTYQHALLYELKTSPDIPPYYPIGFNGYSISDYDGSLIIDA